MHIETFDLVRDTRTKESRGPRRISARVVVTADEQVLGDRIANPKSETATVCKLFPTELSEKQHKITLKTHVTRTGTKENMESLYQNSTVHRSRRPISPTRGVFNTENFCTEKIQLW